MTVGGCDIGRKRGGFATIQPLFRICLSIYDERAKESCLVAAWCGTSKK